LAGVITSVGGSNYYYNWGGQEFFDGNWHHYVFSWDLVNIYLYKDGEPVGSPIVHSGNIPIGESRPIIPGGSAWDLGGYGSFDGAIDEFRIWHRALTDEEIRNIYECEKP